MEKAISSRYIALSNLKQKPYRTAALLIVIALTSAVLLGSLIFTSSLKSGITGIQSRLGADLMIVPEGSEQKMESVLLYGTPNYFYMDNNIEEIVRGVEGVDTTTSQIYLATVSDSCCDFPVQIIGFDPKTDFIVKNWAKDRYNKRALESIGDAGAGENASPGGFNEVLFAGCNVNIEKKTVRFFGQIHKVLAKLAKSGSGMDNVIYTDLATLEKIYFDAKQKGFGFFTGDDIRSKASVIFVKLSDGAKPDSTALKIRRAVENQTTQKIQIIQGEKLVSSLMNKLSAILVFLYAICILVLVIAFMTLSVVFSLSINERLKEFSILRVLGASHSTLRGIVFTEAGLLGSGGAIIGIFFSLLIILPFNVLISDKIGLPFAMAGIGQLVIFALIDFALSISACLLSSVFSAVRISKFEPYGEVK
jgi:putative ABC transport system permease protein